MRHIVSAFALALICAGPGASSGKAEVARLPEVAPTKLAADLQQGGYVIYLRHAETDKEGADQINAVMGDCSTQRTLSEKGWQQAQTIGAALRALGIPLADVTTSQYCRAWQTAEIAFGRHVKNGALNFEKAEKYTDNQTEAMKQRLVPLLAKAPPAGFNSVIVGHDDPFEAATGHYPEPQGKLVVVKPDGKGGFALVGGIDPDAWWKLLADQK